MVERLAASASDERCCMHRGVRAETLFNIRSTVEVQVFGIKKSSDTRKALRFFAERRVKTHFVDLVERSASLGELKRFAQKFGVGALIDRESKRYMELGLAHTRYSDERWLDRLVEEPLLLRMPLVRQQHQLTIGLAEAQWKGWVGR